MLFIIMIFLSIIGALFVLPILGMVIFFFLKKNSIINMSKSAGSMFENTFNEMHHQNKHNTSKNSNMSRSEALEVLGLSENSTREQINSAYHRLMKSMHPDKGGSQYFAQKLNQAREILLNEKL